MSTEKTETPSKGAADKADEPKGKATKEAPATQAPPEEPPPPEVIALSVWAKDNQFSTQEDGERRDERITGMIGGFVHAMQAAGKLAATDAEWEADWAAFLAAPA